MVSTRAASVNYDQIAAIITLRYNPYIKSQLSKLIWRDFIEKPRKEPENFVENSIKNFLIETVQKKKLKKICIALSGGIDSTLMLCLLRETLPEIKIEAITIMFAESEDESKKASKLAEFFDANYHPIFVENFFEELPKTISILEQPFWDLMNWYNVVKNSSQISKVLVSGDGGDEVFGGYTFRYSKFIKLTKKDSTPLEKTKAYLECHERDWVPDQSDVFGEKMHFSWNKIYSLIKPYFDNSLNNLAQVFLADFNGKLVYNWIPNYNKLHKHFGVTLLSPLLSPQVMSFSTHLPLEMKYDQKNNIGKLVLRNILAKKLPKKLIQKNKQGFSVDTQSLWKLFGKEICKQYLFDARTTKDKWINQKWIDKHFKKLDEKLDVRYVNKFYSILAFEIWYRLFVTKEMKPHNKL